MCVAGGDQTHFLCCNCLKLLWMKIWKIENGGKVVSATAGRPKVLFEQILHISKKIYSFIA